MSTSSENEIKQEGETHALPGNYLDMATSVMILAGLREQAVTTVLIVCNQFSAFMQNRL